MVSDVVNSARVNVDEVGAGARMIATKLPALVTCTKEAVVSTGDAQARIGLMTSVKDVSGGIQRLLILIKVPINLISIEEIENILSH